jgi:hypothetical protein
MSLIVRVGTRPQRGRKRVRRAFQPADAGGSADGTNTCTARPPNEALDDSATGTSSTAGDAPHDGPAQAAAVLACPGGRKKRSPRRARSSPRPGRGRCRPPAGHRPPLRCTPRALGAGRAVAHGVVHQVAHQHGQQGVVAGHRAARLARHPGPGSGPCPWRAAPGRPPPGAPAPPRSTAVRHRVRRRLPGATASATAPPAGWRGRSRPGWRAARAARGVPSVSPSATWNGTYLRCRSPASARKWLIAKDRWPTQDR